MSSGSAATPAPPVINTNMPKPPSLCMKPLPPSAASSPGAISPPITLTSKEWIVPPRPKPGRKPATDTPPTKRKAQNRAAQRAFRERRAARVGELEEQLKEVEDQNEQEQDALRAEITSLENSLEQCQTDLDLWITKCHKLEAELVQAKDQISKQKSQPTLARDAELADQSNSVGCGNCTLESHCQCIDDVVKGINDHAESSSPHNLENSGFDHADHSIKVESSDPNAMEIDFTSAFTKGSNTTRTNHTSADVADPCGFCQDGTPCICAEMAAEQERQNLAQPSSPTLGDQVAVKQLAQFTPPPSEGDVANSSASLSMTCANGPGTCAQCVADPNSTLFCKSLAASRNANMGSSGCCGGRGSDGGCCQTSAALPPRTTRSRASGNSSVRLPNPQPRNPVTLSCADAYIALSRHSAYEQASGDMASWMSKLRATPASVEGRPAMEIDAANVMTVLKDFDRRFASNK